MNDLYMNDQIMVHVYVDSLMKVEDVTLGPPTPYLQLDCLFMKRRRSLTYELWQFQFAVSYKHIANVKSDKRQPA